MGLLVLDQGRGERRSTSKGSRGFVKETSQGEAGTGSQARPPWGQELHLDPVGWEEPMKIFEHKLT